MFLKFSRFSLSVFTYNKWYNLYVYLSMYFKAVIHAFCKYVACYVVKKIFLLVSNTTTVYIVWWMMNNLLIFELKNSSTCPYSLSEGCCMFFYWFCFIRLLPMLVHTFLSVVLMVFPFLFFQPVVYYLCPVLLVSLHSVRSYTRSSISFVHFTVQLYLCTSHVERIFPFRTLSLSI